MDVFPETIIPEYPAEITTALRVLITQLDTGVEYRRRKWRFPLRKVSLRFKYLTPEERKILQEFLTKQAGAFKEFYWFDYVEKDWFDEFVGYGDGSVTSFTLPVKNGSNFKIFVDGVEKIEGVDYTISAGDGPNGEDVVSFSSAPSLGSLITANFTGKLRLTCRLQEDPWTMVHVISNYHSINVELQEVR